MSKILWYHSFNSFYIFFQTYNNRKIFKFLCLVDGCKIILPTIKFIIG